MTLGPKLHHLPHFRHNKNFPQKSESHFKPLFNTCHQVQFQKNLTNLFREKFKNVNFGPQNDLFFSFWAYKEFSLKI